MNAAPLLKVAIPNPIFYTAEQFLLWQDSLRYIILNKLGTNFNHKQNILAKIIQLSFLTEVGIH